VSSPAGAAAAVSGGDTGSTAAAGATGSGAGAVATAGADANGALDRMLDWLGAALEPIYGFRSLLAFKAKFKPDYVPMYLLYPDAAALPAIVNAITRAYLPSINLGQGLTLVRGLLTRR
jgi:hypothetical protein